MLIGAAAGSKILLPQIALNPAFRETLKNSVLPILEHEKSTA